jgi:hypothetical protein
MGKEVSKNFFFEKKAPRPGKQKTLINLGHGRLNDHGPNYQKFFASFF